MAKTRDTVTELPAQDVGFLFGTMFDLTTLPSELKHTGKIAKGEFKIVAHFPAIHEKNGTEAAYLARHRTFRGGLYSTYQDGPYKIDEVNWDATNRAGVHMVTMTKYGQVVEFPSQPSKTMPGSLKLMVQELVESLKTPGFIIRCSGLGGALEPKKGTTDEYNVILLNGDVKCPKKLANHVPTKYHAEDESIFHAQMGPWCGNAEDYQKPPWIKGPGRKTRAMRSAKKQKNIELREKRNAEQMTQMGDSFFPVIPNTGGGDSALGSGRGVPQWYGAESAFDKLANKVAQGYIKKGKSKEEALEIGRKTAYKIGVKKYGKAGMKRKSMEGRMRRKNAEETMNFEFSNLPGLPVVPNDFGESSALMSGNSVPQWYGAEGEGDISHNRIDEEIERPVIIRHDHASTFYKWEVDGPVDDDQEYEIEQEIKNEVGDSPHRGQRDFDFDLYDDHYRIDRKVSVDTDTDYGEGRFYDMAAEEFAAASTARPDLNREKRNVLNAVRGNYDQSFSWSACNWGPYFNRFSAEGSNKFYSVWVWERSPGIYTAMGAYGGLGQNPRLFNVGQTRDLQQAVNMAKKKLQSKQKKGYQTYSAEYFESPYTGDSALSGVGLSTDQLTATVGSGTFDEASLNSSGHMNVFANAETDYRYEVYSKMTGKKIDGGTVRAQSRNDARQMLEEGGLDDEEFEIFNAYADPLSDRQIYKITELGGTVDSTMNRSQASDYIKDLMGKPSGTWRAEESQYISNLSNAIVQFEDSGFSSASAPPNDIYFSEEGSAPVQDPMELGEMANWTPMDGSEGLKRKRAESQVFALTYYLENDINMEDITDVSQALELYLSLNEDIAEMDASGLQKHPRYEVANRMLSDLSYRLDELQTQLPEIDVDIEMDAEYDAWRSAFTDGAAATQIHKYDRNWMQKVMNPRSRQIKSMWPDSETEFMEELKSAEDKNLNPNNRLGLPDYDPYAKGGVFYEGNFLQRLTPLSWSLGMVGAFFLGKKL